MRFLSQLFAPSLLRALVGRTVAVAVGALLVLAAVALYESNDLIAKQFQDEANIVAAAAAKDIKDQTFLAQASPIADSRIPGADRGRNAPHRSVLCRRSHASTSAHNTPMSALS